MVTPVKNKKRGLDISQKSLTGHLIENRAQWLRTKIITCTETLTHGHAQFQAEKQSKCPISRKIRKRANHKKIIQIGICMFRTHDNGNNFPRQKNTIDLNL